MHVRKELGSQLHYLIAFEQSFLYYLESTSVVYLRRQRCETLVWVPSRMRLPPHGRNLCRKGLAPRLVKPRHTCAACGFIYTRIVRDNIMI